MLEIVFKPHLVMANLVFDASIEPQIKYEPRFDFIMDKNPFPEYIKHVLNNEEKVLKAYYIFNSLKTFQRLFTTIKTKLLEKYFIKKLNKKAFTFDFLGVKANRKYTLGYSDLAKVLFSGVLKAEGLMNAISPLRYNNAKIFNSIIKEEIIKGARENFTDGKHVCGYNALSNSTSKIRDISKNEEYLFVPTNYFIPDDNLRLAVYSELFNKLEMYYKIVIHSILDSKLGRMFDSIIPGRLLRYETLVPLPKDVTDRVPVKQFNMLYPNDLLFLYEIMNVSSFYDNLELYNALDENFEVAVTNNIFDEIYPWYLGAKEIAVEINNQDVKFKIQKYDDLYKIKDENKADIKILVDHEISLDRIHLLEALNMYTNEFILEREHKIRASMYTQYIQDKTSFVDFFTPYINDLKSIENRIYINSISSWYNNPSERLPDDAYTFMFLTYLPQDFSVNDVYKGRNPYSSRDIKIRETSII